MKNKLVPLFCVFTLSLIFSQVFAQADSLSVKPLIVQDSSVTSYEWTARGPLNPQLQQQRDDNRAEVESMKRRFRQFHQEISETEKENQSIKEDQDFLWPDAEGSSVDDQVEKNKTASPTTTNTEEMRMQINRSFQQEPIKSPAHLPVSNANVKVDDFGTNEAVSPKGGEPISTETNWEKDAFQSNNTTEIGWQLNLDQNNPLPSQNLKVGEIINMELSFEDRSSVLSATSKVHLNEWVNTFSQYPGIKIEVRSHTHKGISYTEALELTTQRARTIIDYFSTSGVSSQQLHFKGYGNLSPLFSASDANNQQKNERIELIILELPKR